MLNIVGNYSRMSPRSESRAGEEREETGANTPIPGGETGVDTVKSARRAGYHPEGVQRRDIALYETAGAAGRKTRTGQIRTRRRRQRCDSVRHSGRAAGGGGGTDTVGTP